MPVNPRYTSHELDTVLRQGDAEVLIIDHEYLDTLARIDPSSSVPRANIIPLGAPAEGTAPEWHSLLDAADASALPSGPPPGSDDLLTLQFTSGSTGFPKGCMLTQRYWTQIGKVRSRQGPPVQRMLIDMPFHYMGGQWRFLMALYLGATAFVARQPSLAHLIDRLVEHRIDFCSVTPALAKLPQDPRAASLALRWAGTMALPAELHATLEQRLNGAPVREMYGLTETGSTLSMPVEATQTVGSGCCGLPVAFRECRIAAPDGTEVPVGESGELWIAGAGMMRGYYRRPEADAEAWREQDGARWFRTGDLFRRDRDSFHTILGRLKDVIRRSGENISSSEIEAVLAGMPEIVEAAALGVPDPMRGEEVKACVVLQPGLGSGDVPPERILAHCRERLARYKLPRYLEYVAVLPKTPSGKVAKQALRPEGRDLRTDSYDAAEGLWR
jgi:crotonobetaine/carnitine-CoA ligase